MVRFGPAIPLEADGIAGRDFKVAIGAGSVDVADDVRLAVVVSAHPAIIGDLCSPSSEDLWIGGGISRMEATISYAIDNEACNVAMSIDSLATEKSAQYKTCAPHGGDLEKIC